MCVVTAALPFPLNSPPPPPPPPTQLLFIRSFKPSTAAVSSSPCCYSRNKLGFGIENQPDFHLQRRFHSCNSIWNFSVNCSINQGAAGENQEPQSTQHSKGLWSKWKASSAEMSSKLAKLGLAVVLAYGLIDAITYTTFFVLAFLGYEKSTGNNPAANLQALLGIVILMWTGNNVTRPFRVAGAAALAPFVDGGLKTIQNYLKFPNLMHAFGLVVSIVAASCFTVVGLPILSRWGK